MNRTKKWTVPFGFFAVPEFEKVFQVKPASEQDPLGKAIIYFGWAKLPYYARDWEPFAEITEDGDLRFWNEGETHLPMAFFGVLEDPDRCAQEYAKLTANCICCSHTQEFPELMAGRQGPIRHW